MFPNLCVLVVEASPHLRRIYRDLLNQVGLRRILEATDGAEAIGIFEQRRPNIVLVDWDVQLLNGEELVRMIRSPAVSPSPKVPVIVTMAQCTQDNVIKATSAGANEVLAKPISPKALWQHLQGVISIPRTFTTVGAHLRPEQRVFSNADFF
ncbi:response regulator [Chelatococcus sp. SYSU_G07232]|uniref:Response regulator n=1 Tax=Chelatococcus albus TaxID=3047466 RepID=A0ABT7AFB0_9HYPH|nr:response regulator [Chelatococcus sp. SYSU_G07232]MDJ1158041.1 response regulator [Chelatococcus sp. SYSU_G07232]